MAPVRIAETDAVPSSEGYLVVVAVDNPAHVEQLVRTAAAVATLHDGDVHVVSVVHKPHQSPFSVFTDETILADFDEDRTEVLYRAAAAGADAGTTVSGEVVVDKSPVRGILRTVDRVDANAVLLGWQETTGRVDAALGTAIDAVLERASCDVLVERVGESSETVDAVLLSTAGGVHAELAATAACAIAAANDATVTVLSLAAGDVSFEAATRHAQDARDRLADHVPTSVDVRTPADEPVADVVVDAAADHDVVVLGATRRGLRRRFAGSVARSVARRSNRTVVLARRGSGRSSLLDLLRP